MKKSSTKSSGRSTSAKTKAAKNKSTGRSTSTRGTSRTRSQNEDSQLTSDSDYETPSQGYLSSRSRTQKDSATQGSRSRTSPQGRSAGRTSSRQDYDQADGRSSRTYASSGRGQNSQSRDEYGQFESDEFDSPEFSRSNGRSRRYQDGMNEDRGWGMGSRNEEGRFTSQRDHNADYGYEDEDDFEQEDIPMRHGRGQFNQEEYDNEQEEMSRGYRSRSLRGEGRVSQPQGRRPRRPSSDYRR